MSYSSQSRGPPPIEGMYSLKVDNLTYRTSPETLRRQFDKFGEVGDIYIPRDRYTKESRGFAFIRYYDKRDAEDAMDGMDGKMLDGRELRVQMARYGRPAEPQQRRHSGPRYGGGGGYGGGGYGGGGYGYRGGGGRYDRRSPRRRSYSRSRSRSRSRERRRRSYSRSRSRSHSRSKSKSPVDGQNAKSRSRSKSRSVTPDDKND